MIMGVADGPVFAPDKPGSKPIVADPCGCPECVAGPGLEFGKTIGSKILGKLTSVTTHRFCAMCKKLVVVTSFREEEPEEHWLHVCERQHVWRTYDQPNEERSKWAKIQIRI